MSVYRDPPRRAEKLETWLTSWSRRTIQMAKLGVVKGLKAAKEVGLVTFGALAGAVIGEGYRTGIAALAVCIAAGCVITWIAGTIAED